MNSQQVPNPPDKSGSGGQAGAGYNNAQQGRCGGENCGFGLFLGFWYCNWIYFGNTWINLCCTWNDLGSTWINFGS